MPSIPQIVTTMQTLLTDVAEQAAHQTGFVRRQRALSGTQFVQTLVCGWLAHPDATYETLVALATDLGVSITPQGLCDRFTDAAVHCLEHVLRATMQHALANDPAVLPLLDRFAAVEVQDSTTITLPDTLAAQWRGCGGSHGRVNAATKAQFRWELRSGRLEGPLLQHGYASDRAIAFARRSPAGTLSIRDLGYWHLDDLTQDAQDGRFFLTRLKPGTALFDSDNRRWHLEEVLEGRAEDGDPLELTVKLGVAQRLDARLLARQVSAEVAAQRVKVAERTARRKGRPLSASTRALCAWEVVVTNVDRSLLSSAEAWLLIRVRWQIELLFKLWKQHGRLEASRGTQPKRVLCELYAKFIGLLMQHWLILAGCWTLPNRSMVKAAKVVRTWAERIARALACRERLTQTLSATVAAIHRAGRQAYRHKQPATWQLLGGTFAGLT